MKRQEIFRSKIEPHMKMLAVAAYRMTGKREEAQDILQETLIKAYRNSHTLDLSRDPKAWLFTILRNAFIDSTRKKNLELLMPDANFIEQVKDEKNSTASEVEFEDRLQRALDQLPEEIKTVLIAREVEGLSYDEIAKLTNTPLGTVKSRIKRGREKLLFLLG